MCTLTNDQVKEIVLRKNRSFFSNEMITALTRYAEDLGADSFAKRALYIPITKEMRKSNCNATNTSPDDLEGMKTVGQMMKYFANNKA